MRRSSWLRESGAALAAVWLAAMASPAAATDLVEA